MAQVSTETTAKSSVLARVGVALTIAAAVALAVPLLYLLYGVVNGHVTLDSSDAVSRLFTLGIALTGAAGVLALIATGIHGSTFATSTGAAGAPSGIVSGKGVLAGISAVLLVASTAFLFTTLLPRANAIQNLNDNIAPFAMGLQRNCQNPLDQTQKDTQQADRDAHAAGSTGNDQGYVTTMETDVGNLQNDLSALTTALNNLKGLRVPDPKYQALLNGCEKDVTSEIDLLSQSNAIQLPAQAVAAVGISSLSLTTLLQDSIGVIKGTLPVSIPHKLVYQLVEGVLDSIDAQASDPQLTAEGNQLRDDINNTLKNNLAPFVPGPALQA